MDHTVCRAGSLLTRACEDSGFSSRPREHRCDWRKVPGPRGDWLPAWVAPTSLAAELLSCGSSGLRAARVRVTGLSSLPVPGAMQPLALLCALCCGLLAVAAHAGCSEDRRSWRGRYDPREQPPGAAFSPRRGPRDGVVRPLGWESLRPGTKSLASLQSAKDAGPQFPPPQSERSSVPAGSGCRRRG